jgi:hypothetical protein
MVYRFRKRVQREGDNGFANDRHGRPFIVHGETLTFVVESCQATPGIASLTLQRPISERFTSTPGVSQFNCVRVRLGIFCLPMPREKSLKQPSPLSQAYSCWQQPMRPPWSPIWQRHDQQSRRKGSLHLWAVRQQREDNSCFPCSFLGQVACTTPGIYVVTHLRLALLSGPRQAYGYRYSKAFLSQIAP